MGCLTAIFELSLMIFNYALIAFIWFLEVVFIIIKTIVNLIADIIKKKKENQSNKYHNYQNTPNHIEPTPKKSIIKDYSYLKIYISKKYPKLIKNDELNYKLLGIESYDAPDVYYDEDDKVKGYNTFYADELSSITYGNLLQKLHAYCKDDFYATIQYEKDKIDYKITSKDNNIYLNNNNVNTMKTRYNFLKNKIISFSDKLLDYFIYIKDNDFYYNVVPNDDLDCDSIETLAYKLKETDNILICEIPYMEEISRIIDIIEPKIIKESEKGEKSIVLPKIEYQEEPTSKSRRKTNKKASSWRDIEFEKEADLWGLSKEDRRIAKEEGMSPAEFIEAEEYDDDELMLDDWER